MRAIIEWCNDNSGFVSAVLTLVTVLISILAIVISIKMARLPFKKKLRLSGTIGYVLGTGISTPTIGGFYVNVCNMGNREVNIKFLGFAVSKNQKKNRWDYDLLYNFNGSNRSEFPVKPTEIFEVFYPAEGFIKSLQSIDRRRSLFFFLQDTEGKTIKKKFKTVDEVLVQFGL